MDLEKDNEFFSFDFMVMVGDAYVEFAYKKFRELLIESRKRRREVIGDLQKYKKIALQCKLANENFLQHYTDQVLEDCNIDKDKYMKTEIDFVSGNKGQMSTERYMMHIETLAVKLMKKIFDSKKKQK